MKISLAKRTALAITFAIITSANMIFANPNDKKPTITPLFKAVKVLESRVKDDMAHTVTLHSIALEALIHECFNTKNNASAKVHAAQISLAIAILERDAQLILERIATETDGAKKEALNQVHTILAETATDLKHVCEIIKQYQGVTNLPELVIMASKLQPYKQKGLLPASFRKLTAMQLKEIFQHRMSCPDTVEPTQQ